MTALALSLLAQFWPYLLAGAGILWGLWKARQSGIRSERAKQVGRDLAAAEDRLEMDREATDIERKVADLTDAEALKEAMRWARD